MFFPTIIVQVESLRLVTDNEVMNTTKLDKFFDSIAIWLIILFCISLLTTTAGTNICLFLLLMISPWVWKKHKWTYNEWELVKPIFILIAIFCLLDLLTNLFNGHSIGESLQALRHVRKFFFILLLWPFFAIARYTRIAILTLLATVLVLAVANLIWSVGFGRSELMMSSMPNMHGQILVGITLALIHGAIQNRKKPKLMWLGAAVLVISLFFGSTRRTGYLLFAIGGLLLVILLYQQVDRKHKSRFLWTAASILLALFLFAILSQKVQQRMLTFYNEFQEFFHMSERERSTLQTSVGLRLQYVVSSLEIIRNNLWLGVGSLTFKPLFWEVNQSMGANDPKYFAPNPHNEYLYMWATKGLLGLGIYLGIFFQACHIAAKRKSDWQKHSLWIFICLFLVSILFNSMSIDMVEGHFMMLVLLCFLAPSDIFTTTDRSETAKS